MKIKNRSLVALLFCSLLPRWVFAQTEAPLPYHPDELADLRAFLRQARPDGKMNGESFSLKPEDTLTWNDPADLTWFETSSVKGFMSWDTAVDGYRRVTGISFNNHQLGGYFSMPHCTYIKKITLQHNRTCAIDSIDLTKHTYLTEFSTKTTTMTQIDLSQNTALKTLRLTNVSNLLHLDLKANTQLEVLYVNGTKIDQLDLSRNRLLATLDCSNCSQLATLNFQDNLLIESLNCATCPLLTELNISSMTNLKILTCSNNALKTLDLRGNMNLGTLSASTGKLERVILPPKGVLSSISLQNNQLVSIENLDSLPRLSSTLALYGNRLTSIDVSGDTSLSIIECYNNQLTEIKGLETIHKLSRLLCYNNCLTALPRIPSGGMSRMYFENNSLRLSTIGITRFNPVTGKNIGQYKFFPQDTVNGGAIMVDDVIDLSSEHVVRINDTIAGITTYSWFEIAADGTATEIDMPVISDGKFQPTAAMGGKKYRCRMLNPLFVFHNNKMDSTGYPFFYEVYVAGDETYPSEEMDRLRAFLRQPSAMEGQCNAQVLQLDTTDWKSTSLWVYDLEGLKFETDGEKVCHIVSVNWNNRGLSGKLDLRGFTALRELDVAGNRLMEVCLDQTENIEKVNVKDNDLKFSTLPKVVPSVAFYYAPQGVVEGGHMYFNHVVDLSAEKTVAIEGNTTSTIYRWFEKSEMGNIPIELEEEGGGRFFIPAAYAGKTLLCEMENPAFSGTSDDSALTLTYRIVINRRIDYEETEVAKLKCFLRQDGNFERVGLSVADTLAWNMGNDWILGISGLEWKVNEANEGNLYSMAWANKNLSGVLDLSGFLELTTIHLETNRLSSVDVSHCPALEEIRIQTNVGLADLDLTACTALTRLAAYTTALTTLDLSTCTDLERIDAYNARLENLRIGVLENLATVNVQDNLLDSLNLRDCSSLSAVNVNNNRLKCLVLDENAPLTYLSCTDNVLSFATLPRMVIDVYMVHPQAIMEGGKIPASQKIDLSSQNSVIFNNESVAANTVYNWFDAADSSLLDAKAMSNDGNGVFTASAGLGGKSVFCCMTNSKYPGLTLVYTVTFEESLDQYFFAELEDLRNYLSQENKELDKTNGVLLGLTDTQMDEWETSAAWVKKLTESGVLIWTLDETGTSQRLSVIKIDSFQQAGVLSMPSCTMLTQIDANDNMLQEVDVTKNKALTHLDLAGNRLSTLSLSGLKTEEVDISRNKFRFSTIPLDFEYRKYIYAPQDTVLLPEQDWNTTVDLSAEYMLQEDNSHTFYRWEILEGSDWKSASEYIEKEDAGKFTFKETSAGNHFRCNLSSSTDELRSLTMQFYVYLGQTMSNEKMNGCVEVNAYPNPTSGKVVVEVSAMADNFRLYDIRGYLLQETRQSGFNVVFDLSSYPSGFYVVKAGNRTVKILKK